MCRRILEDEMELFTQRKFHAMTEEQHENVNSSLMTERKLQEIYKDKINFVAKSCKSDIIVPSDINSTLTEVRYNEREVSNQMKRSAL